MRAAVVNEPGATPTYAEFRDPEPTPGHEIVELVAAAIHPVVRSKASGRHYSSSQDYPLVPGVDAVARRADGTLVYAGGVEEPWGTFAEKILVPSMAMAPIPNGGDPLVIAAGMNPGMSSWMPLTEHRDSRSDLGTVLVLGPTGMAGGLAVQNAKLLGATRVVGAGRGADDLARVASLGAEVVELTDDTQTNATAIAAALDGAAPSLVLDYLWGDAAEATFAALAGMPPEDRTDYVEIGAVISNELTLPASLLRSRRLRLSGSGIGSFDMRRYLAEARTYLRHLGGGRIDISFAPYPITQVSQAWEAAPGLRPVITAA